MVKLTSAEEHSEMSKQSKTKRGITLVTGNSNCNQNVKNVPFGKAIRFTQLYHSKT